MNSVLVSGAAGFIGHAVARALTARGVAVTGIDNINDYYPVALKRARLADLAESAGDRFDFVALDFADADALSQALVERQFDAIVHLGAQPGVRYSLDHPQAYARSNLVGHLNMLELARARRVVHMVYASSSSVYGNSAEQPLSVDQRTDHPISLYAATKKADELMSETYAHLFGIPLTGLRFFTVYGPWGRPDMAVWSFTRDIMAGRPIRVTNGGNMLRDFTYVDDIVAGIIACLAQPPVASGTPNPGGSRAPHAIYNIGNNAPERLDRLIDIIEEACGQKAVRIDQPVPPGDVIATFADISQMQQKFGFSPATSLDRGIADFVSWYRDFRLRPGMMEAGL